MKNKIIKYIIVSIYLAISSIGGYTVSCFYIIISKHNNMMKEIHHQLLLNMFSNIFFAIGFFITIIILLYLHFKISNILEKLYNKQIRFFNVKKKKSTYLNEF